MNRHVAEAPANTREAQSSEGLTPFFVGAMAVAVANLRPTYVGETQSLPVCVVLLTIEALILLKFYSDNARLSFGKIALAQIFLSSFIAIYVLERGAFDPKIGNDVFKAFLILGAFLTAVAIAVSKARYTLVFFDTFAVIVIASSVGLLATFFLVGVGIPISSLTIAHLPNPSTYGGGVGDIAFPFTHVTNEAMSWIGTAPRLAGLFREVGCFPPFACWAAAYGFLRGWRLAWSAICLLASILCLSTIGPLAIYTGAMLLLFRLGVRPLHAAGIVIGLGILGWPILYTMDYVGLEQKINSGTGSYEDREWLFWAVLDTQDFVFGDGSGWSEVSSSAGINLISQIRVLGLVYFAPVVAIYLLPIGNPRFWLSACVPAIATVAFSQPISIEPAFLMIFLSAAAFSPGAAVARRTAVAFDAEIR